MQASYHQYILNFKRPSGTSRGIMNTKETWYIIINDNGKLGVGECGILRGLSCDDREDYEEKLKWTCDHIHMGLDALYDTLIEFPSIQFGLEMAFKSLSAEQPFDLFPSPFTKHNDPIPINGLVWMGDKSFMLEQIKDKIDQGFDCIKLKIGAIDFNAELDLLHYIRKQFSVDDIEIRVDANGAFNANEALERLKLLSEYQLHSIEQPIQPRQFDAMAKLCEETPIPIALDEELIGVLEAKEKHRVLNIIKPQYIILKPSLIGGYMGSKAWISYAEEMNIKWWITSALESNVGLNAIAQWTYTLKNPMPQGLGTGGLFVNNFDSPLIVKNGTLQYDNNKAWKFDLI